MLGASVDGRVTCDCCGVGNLEIKSPFSHRDKNIQQYVNQRNSCLAQSTDTVDVEYILKQNHPYYTLITPKYNNKCMSLEHCTLILWYTYRKNQPQS